MIKQAGVEIRFLYGGMIFQLSNGEWEHTFIGGWKHIFIGGMGRNLWGMNLPIPWICTPVSKALKGGRVTLHLNV